MSGGLFRKIADMREADSLVTRLRRRRMRQFLGLLERLPAPLRILDVGGTQFFWDMLGLAASEQCQITLINPIASPASRPHFTAIVGDGCDMPMFADQSFDVVFSNSVIEHVGSYANQQRMAREIMRIGRRYFVQTPNYWFPLEPHFFVPGFQFLPVGVRARLLQRFSLGWFPRTPDYDRAYAEVSSIRLLRRREMAALFPGGRVQAERVGPLAIGWIATGGWG